ncbi:MAG: amidohydrolase family protein [Verrucomicrobiae bacterium]|nr:amidohydrolase family protein [Verrucomicrobiae bacterium]
MNPFDVNASIGHWPFQKFDLTTPAALCRHLKKTGIRRALVSCIDSVLYPDPAVFDDILFKTAKAHPMLVPVPTVNPSLSNWRASLRRDSLAAVKIIPNYHRYNLDDPSVAELAGILEKQKIPLLIQMRVDDERNQCPFMKVPGVETEKIIRFARRFPKIPMVCLCPYFGEAIQLAQKTANLHVDISFIETFQTLQTLLKNIPSSRVLFGSHTPFLCAESALMKLSASKIPAKAIEDIALKNAGRIFKL